MYHTACEPQLLRNNQYERHSLVAFCSCVCCTCQATSFDVFKPRKISSIFSQFGYCLQWNTLLKTFLCICELFSFKPGTSGNVQLDLHCHFLQDLYTLMHHTKTYDAPMWHTCQLKVTNTDRLQCLSDKKHGSEPVNGLDFIRKVHWCEVTNDSHHSK